MKDDLISIIVPVYNSEKFIGRCVESIQSQTHRNLEIILIDDGSTDGSASLCDNYAQIDSRIKVIHKTNGGASSARNVGLHVAHGRYIGFVDSDDWISYTMYERLYTQMRKNDADMAICRMTRVAGERMHEEVLSYRDKIQVWSKNDCLDFFFKKNGESFTYSMACRLVKKELLDGYSFIEGRMNEDIHSSYYVSVKTKKAVFLNEPLYFYYKNKSGVTSSNFNQKKLDLLYIWDEVDKLVDQLSPEYKSYCDINKKRARFTLLSQMFINGYDKTDGNLKIIKKDMKKEVRSCFFDLMKLNMSISRKILLVIVCIA